MTDPLLTLPEGNPVGEVVCTQSYFTYDSIILLARGSRNDEQFFIILADQTENTLIYLYALTTTDQFNSFEREPLNKGATYTLLQRSDELWVVSFAFDADTKGDLVINTSYSRCQMTDLPDRWLPVQP